MSRGDQRAAHQALAEELRSHPAVIGDVDVVGTAGNFTTEIAVQGDSVPPDVLQSIAAADLSMTHLERHDWGQTTVIVR